jgi:hypothetical protein
MTDTYHLADVKRERSDRDVFEERVYAQYFISQIKRTGLGGCMELGVKPDTKTKAELCARGNPVDPDDYADPYVSAMWWGFKTALEQAFKFKG